MEDFIRMAIGLGIVAVFWSAAIGIGCMVFVAMYGWWKGRK